MRPKAWLRALVAASVICRRVSMPASAAARIILPAVLPPVSAVGRGTRPAVTIAVSVVADATALWSTIPGVLGACQRGTDYCVGLIVLASMARQLAVRS